MTNGGRIRVLVADESVIRRQALASVLSSEPALSLVAAVGDGAALRAGVLAQAIDVVVIDAGIPRAFGGGLLHELRMMRPNTRVIVIEGEDGGITAADEVDAVVSLPPTQAGMSQALQRARQRLVPRVKELASLRSTALPTAPAPGPRLIAIGASTGGPDALAALCRALPASFAVPIVIAQHMPAGFTRALAERLASVLRRPVIEASSDVPLGRGAVVLAAGDVHVAVAPGAGGELRARPSHAPPENQVRPSADLLFRSAAKVAGNALVAVVLTGMGKDGMAGCAAVRAAGGRVLVQDEASSVVWGMPGSVVKAGLADEVAPVAELADSLALAERGLLPARGGSR